MRLHTKDHRIGLFKGKHFYKLQIERFRLYLSFIPMKPKYESVTRRSFRKQLLERSDKCSVCGKQLDISTLSVHHIKPRHLYPELGYSLSAIASMNYEKLRSRQLRHTLSGSGDNR